MGKTLVLTLSSPDQRNALGPEIYAAGVQALEQAGHQAQIGSVVITGEGANFCAGGNLQRLLANRSQPPEGQEQSIEQLHAWLSAIRQCPKPVIAAVEGACAGAGFSLALACDLLVAARDTVFVMAYANVGLSPDGGASWSLSRALPRVLANEIFLTGNRCSALQLQQWGLVNQTPEPGQALSQAMKLSKALNARAPNVLASIKSLVQSAQQCGWAEQLALERDHFVANLHHPNGLEGIDAFLSKREPKYL